MLSSWSPPPRGREMVYEDHTTGNAAAPRVSEPGLAARAHRPGNDRAGRDELRRAERRDLPARIRRAAGAGPRPARDRGAVAQPGRLPGVARLRRGDARG